MQLAKYVQPKLADPHIPVSCRGVNAVSCKESFSLDLVGVVRRRPHQAGTCFQVLTKAVGIKE